MTETELSYRKQDVDRRLDKHDNRIRRLEKFALVVVGYVLAEGGSLATAFLGFI